ncbi:MAG: hypothetical protein KME30_19975 [Iphinoe sp. HA4291-MV1]|jgi:mRNA-degrading endonuclease YafQ of YafQ-DinJ toxin-antitoxin module|nr:hypothetical protein [Iphinoe sp. HA4291-MV1]
MTLWNVFSGNLLAFQKLSTEETLCGVGIWGFPWYQSGGYTYLHRNVPIFLVEQDQDFEQLTQSFNYLVANVPVPPQYQNYALQQCWKSTCLYKRQGSCVQTPDKHINQVLKQRGE